MFLHISSSWVEIRPHAEFQWQIYGWRHKKKRQVSLKLMASLAEVEAGVVAKTDQQTNYIVCKLYRSRILVLAECDCCP